MTKGFALFATVFALVILRATQQLRVRKYFQVLVEVFPARKFQIIF